MAAMLQPIFSSLLIILTLVLADAHGTNHHHGASTSHGFALGPWKDAKATFYGEADGSGTFEGACGYEGQVKELYGLDTAALSAALFKDGATCGSCYEIKCAEGNQGCKPGHNSVTVTATNLCPGGGLGWCNPPNEHFDLSQPAFLKIAEYKAGIVPVKYRRVPCKKRGGIRFKITGNPFFNLVTITNVGGAGDVTKVEVMPENGEWSTLTRNWGMKWECNQKLVGQKLSFRITTSDGRTLVSEQAAPSNWQFGHSFEGKNFL